MCAWVCYVVPDTASALAVGPIKPIVGQARSEAAVVCILCSCYLCSWDKREDY